MSVKRLVAALCVAVIVVTTGTTAFARDIAPKQQHPRICAYLLSASPL